LGGINLQPRVLEGIKFLKDTQWVLWTRIVLCVFLFIFYYFWFANLNTGDNKLKKFIDGIFCGKEITSIFCVLFIGERKKRKRELFYNMIKEIWDELVLL